MTFHALRQAHSVRLCREGRSLLSAPVTYSWMQRIRRRLCWEENARLHIKIYSFMPMKKVQPVLVTHAGQFR